MNPFNTPLSILDLVLIKENQTTHEALKDSKNYIESAEEMGFNRFWVAEHHNSKAIASSATSVIISYLAQNTSKIRVGSGGIMLPNHSPLQVAENFGTLAELYGNRIDLGIGRAPGTDMATAQALRRNMQNSVENYPQDVIEVLQYLSNDSSLKVNAFPGKGTEVPVWILGSSIYSAQLAAQLGLPYSFASHFAPQQLSNAKDIYRRTFKPSRFLDKPYFMPCVNVVTAETQEEAEYQSTTGAQFGLSIIRRDGKKLQAPVRDLDKICSPQEKFAIEQMRKYSFVGTPDVVQAKLNNFIEKYEADEIMITSYFYNSEVRKKSMELLIS